MQSPLQITFRSMAHSDALANHIERRVEKLSHRYDRIVSCHVVIELAGHHHTRGERFQVTVNLGLPGHEILVTHAPPEHGNFDGADEVADRAFDEVDRQLTDWVKRRREEQHHPHG